MSPSLNRSISEFGGLYQVYTRKDLLCEQLISAQTISILLGTTSISSLLASALIFLGSFKSATYNPPLDINHRIDTFLRESEDANEGYRKQNMRIKHTIAMATLTHKTISHMPYSCDFLELVKITVAVCFCLYNVTQYSLIDP